MSGHKFNPENRKKLTGKERERILPTAQVLKDIGISVNDIWADIGCGTGFFTIPLAGEVKQVYALDLRAEMLEDLNNSLTQLKISNVIVLQSDENKFPLAEQLVDGVLLSLVLHEVDEPVKFFCELNRILKKDGRLVVIEWVKASLDMGPPIEHRLSIQQLDDWAQTSGFAKSQSWQWSENFIGVEYSKIS